MQDRPTAIELLKAAKDFCETELGPSLEGRMRVQVRVLQNILGILERELLGEEPALVDELATLNALLGTATTKPSSFTALRETVHAKNAELSAAIRNGDFDERFDEAVTALDAVVAAKIAIANPGWVSDRPDR